MILSGTRPLAPDHPIGPKKAPSAPGPGLVSIALVAFLLCPAATWATSFIMATDDELVARSSAIVLGRVVARDQALDALRPTTEYFVEVERILKGFVPAGVLRLQIPGGEAQGGITMRVLGAPELAEGERIVAFLDDAENGAWQPADLTLSIFEELESSGESYAVRQLSGGHDVVSPGDSESERRALSFRARRLDAFVDWIEVTAAGRTADVDYFVDEPTQRLLSLEPKFVISTIPECNNRMLRNRDFQGGGNLPFRANSTPQPNLPGGGYSDLQPSMNAWNNDSESQANIRYQGTTGNSNGAQSNDNVNTILFEDPNNEINGSFNGSGTLATTTLWFACTLTHSFKGSQVLTIVEVDIVTQDGFGANYLAINNATVAFREVIAHEFGHSIGISHSSNSNALMTANVHNDGRGASLTNDDRNAVRFLYPLGQTGVGPEAPSDLDAEAISTSEIQLVWTDNATNEDSFEVQQMSVGGAWLSIASLPQDTSAATVTGLAELAYRIFRVRARNSSGDSDYSNEASATTRTSPGSCMESSTAICLNGDRFRASVSFLNQLGGSGDAVANELTDDTGYFTFLNPDNVEIILKVLNACGGFDRYWVFAAGLTNVEVTVVVVDTSTGHAQTYFNPLTTQYQPIQDIDAFATCP